MSMTAPAIGRRGLPVFGPRAWDPPVRGVKAGVGTRVAPVPEAGTRGVSGAGAAVLAMVRAKGVPQERVGTENVPVEKVGTENVLAERVGAQGGVSAERVGDVLNVGAEAVQGEAARVPVADRPAEGLSAVGLRRREGRSCGSCPRRALTPTTCRRLTKVYGLRALPIAQQSLIAR